MRGDGAGGIDGARTRRRATRSDRRSIGRRRLPAVHGRRASVSIRLVRLSLGRAGSLFRHPAAEFGRRALVDRSGRGDRAGPDDPVHHRVAGGRLGCGISSHAGAKAVAEQMADRGHRCSAGDRFAELDLAGEPRLHLHRFSAIDSRARCSDREDRRIFVETVSGARESVHCPFVDRRLVFLLPKARRRALPRPGMDVCRGTGAIRRRPRARLLHGAALSDAAGRRARFCRINGRVGPED